MKRIVALVLALAVLFSLSACGKSKAAKEADELIISIGTVTLDSESAIIKAEDAVAALSSDDVEDLENMELLKSSRAKFDELKAAEEKRIEEERVINLVTSESWFGIFDGDEYKFNKDGSGSHDGVTFIYKIEDGYIFIMEGAAGTTKVELTIDESSSDVKLVMDNTDTYYVHKASFDNISERIRAEYTAELIGHNSWAFYLTDVYVMSYAFYEDGSGIAVIEKVYTLEWEFVDNNTLKITVNMDQPWIDYYDIVVENGSYKLVLINDTLADDTAITATPYK